MTVEELIGKVVALYLQIELADDRSGSADGTARFTIDCLDAAQTAAVARQILADATLAAKIDLKLPERFLAGQGLPADVLTPFPATYFRNAECPRQALLIANTGDDEEQSLKEFVRIGTQELFDHTGLWVRVAGEGLGLTEANTKWWEKALAGLQELRIVSLDRLGAYVLRTREAVRVDGLPILSALGVALPALRLPRDTVFSNRVKEGARGHTSAWKAQFAWVDRNRGCYLRKQTPSQLLLGEDDLRAAFEKVKEAIPDKLHPAIEDFMQAPSGWNAASEELAECEWEQVKPLFDGLKREKFNLGKETLSFYDDREPELLDDDERVYLRLLAERSATEATEEDSAFYESHRNELKEERKLKSVWDRFVFGKPRETEDFLAGLAAAMESLLNKGEAGSKRRLKIRCDRATKKDMKELNVDAGLYFALRYAGLKTLFGDRVSWNVGQLFDFPALVEGWVAQGKNPLNRSTAKAALQLRFVIELEVSLEAGGSQSYSTQLVWKFNPNAIASQFYDDWSRLEGHPLVFSRAGREPVSAKGTLQSVDLTNVKTFVPAYDRDRGSFISVYRKANDLALAWRENLRLAESQQLLSATDARGLEDKFAAFEEGYANAIRGLRTGGLTDAGLHTQLTAYSDLLDTIARRAKGG